MFLLPLFLLGELSVLRSLRGVARHTYTSEMAGASLPGEFLLFLIVSMSFSVQAI